MCGLSSRQLSPLRAATRVSVVEASYASVVSCDCSFSTLDGGKPTIFANLSGVGTLNLGEVGYHRLTEARSGSH